MTARAHNRGWPIVYRNGQWIDEETNKPMDEKRKCKRCKRQPTPEGFDACLGHIENAVSACCGHGVEDGYIIR